MHHESDDTRDARATMPAPTPRLVVVAADPRDRVAIQRTLHHCDVFFASTTDEAEELVRSGLASGFYVF